MKIRSQQIRRRNTMLSELAELIAEEMKRLGIAGEKATDSAGKVVYQLHRRWAGIVLTFPTNDDLVKQRIKMYILERYDGTNADELVREFHVTERYIYNLVQEHRRSKIDKNQLKFDLEEPAD
ncbi:Mor transcription activator family protein [Pseudomonas citronellolis]|uniref:Mor transcription activator family protein n=1 Tax=Pseudomonas citronellolis TaxID=53408 RepID=UPI000853E0C5|nr:Mor transcription activator family protein [Pseudomonas humi]